MEDQLKSPQILTKNSVNRSNTYLVVEAQDDVNLKDTQENLFPCPTRLTTEKTQQSVSRRGNARFRDEVEHR